MKKLILTGALACAAASPAFAAVILDENFNDVAAFGASALFDSTSDNWDPTRYWAINSPVNGFTFTGDVYYATNDAETDGAVLLNEGGGGGVAQRTLSGLTPGAIYTLTLNVFGDNIPGAPYGLVVKADATTILTYAALDQAPGFYGGSGGPQLTTTFTASGTSTTLSFEETTPAGSGASPIIDNIRVVGPDPAGNAVPEPATGALLLAGLGLIGVARRRPSGAPAAG